MLLCQITTFKFVIKFFIFLFVFLDTSCEMIRYQNKVGDDSKWGEAPTLSTIEACENYCLTKTTCKSVHYESNTCFVYYQTTLVSDKDGVIYSEKHCSDTQCKYFGHGNDDKFSMA